MERDAGLPCPVRGAVQQKLQFFCSGASNCSPCSPAVGGHRPSVGRSGQERVCEAHRLQEDLARQLGRQPGGAVPGTGGPFNPWGRPAVDGKSPHRAGSPRAGRTALPPLPHQNDQERKYRTNEKLLSLCFAHCPCLPHFWPDAPPETATPMQRRMVQSTSPTLTEPETTSQQETAAPVDVNVMALKGPTAMGMVGMIDSEPARH